MSTISWSQDDIQLLQYLVTLHGNKWKLISKQFNHITPMQCRNKANALARSAHWTEEEKMKFHSLYRMTPPYQMKHHVWISNMMQTKTPLECWFEMRKHAEIKKNRWSFEEKILLCENDNSGLCRSKEAIRKKRRYMIHSGENPWDNSEFTVPESAYTKILDGDQLLSLTVGFDRGISFKRIQEEVNVNKDVFMHYYLKLVHKQPIPSKDVMLYLLELYKTYGVRWKYICCIMNRDYPEIKCSRKWCAREIKYLCT